MCCLRTSMGRRIFQSLLSSRGAPEFNDLFLPGRMAYSIDLEADDEIPTTVIRSKADLQGIEVGNRLYYYWLLQRLRSYRLYRAGMNQYIIVHIIYYQFGHIGYVVHAQINIFLFIKFKFLHGKLKITR